MKLGRRRRRDGTRGAVGCSSVVRFSVVVFFAIGRCSTGSNQQTLLFPKRLLKDVLLSRFGTLPLWVFAVASKQVLAAFTERRELFEEASVVAPIQEEKLRLVVEGLAICASLVLWGTEDALSSLRAAHLMAATVDVIRNQSPRDHHRSLCAQFFGGKNCST